MDLQLAGKRVLITGASEGIGAGLALAFAAEGARVCLTARNVARLARIAADIEDRFPDASVLVAPADLEIGGAAVRLADTVGDVDILVNNAGAIPSGSLGEIDEATWRRGWELKVFGYINLCRAYYGRMEAAGGGVIVNNIGTGGEVLDPRYIAGAVGNAGLMALTRALGGSSLDQNIRVLGVNPGPVNTERIRRLVACTGDAAGDDRRYAEIVRGFPLGRAAHVTEIADTILFLASPRSSYTSGTIVTVDGGLAARRSLV